MRKTTKPATFDLNQLMSGFTKRKAMEEEIRRDPTRAEAGAAVVMRD
jgi:hypothetical protein